MTVEIDKTDAGDTGEGGAEEGKSDEGLLYPGKDADVNVDKDAEGDKDAGADKDGADDKDADSDADKDKDADKDADKDKDADVDADKDTGDAEPVKAADLKFPEDTAINQVVQEKFLEFANKNKFTTEQVQGLVDIQEDLNAAMSEAHQDQIDAWEKEIGLDKEFVGDTGDKLDENRALARKAMDMVDIKGLPELMSREQTGLGSHPAVFALFVKIGKVISEDSFRSGGAGGSAEPKTDAEALYGKT